MDHLTNATVRLKRFKSWLLKCSAITEIIIKMESERYARNICQLILVINISRNVENPAKA